MTLQDFSRHLQGLEAKIRRQMEHDLPLKAGNHALRRFKENFQKEGFFGRRWKEVKRRQNPKTRGAARTRRILTGQTGDLGRSLQLSVESGRATITSDLPYSAAHNEGTSTAGRGHKIVKAHRYSLSNVAKYLSTGFALALPTAAGVTYLASAPYLGVIAFKA